ncbi:hypothetical protein C1H46_023418 [Malus baccata]|uniref:Uncharacterized protein n=1 Tax=Malus baccata TaxID=106549 RepID=A0A540LWU8_MALBA|nr:hypothetical protein C1H46_023418 [Malus baccata]
MREDREVKESQRKSREGVEAEPFDDDRRVDRMIEEEVCRAMNAWAKITGIARNDVRKKGKT